MAPFADDTVIDVEHQPVREFARAVLAGLAQAQKQIPSKFFYDAEGSRLFDKICELPEYYPTRTEISILRDNAAAIAEELPPGAVLVEYGSGASVKVRLLLDAMQRPAAYVPIDISREHLRAAAAELAGDYPRLSVLPVHADFTKPLMLRCRLPEGPRVGFFPGSTIGNFHPPEATRLLSGFAQNLGPGGLLLIGVDLKKDPRILHAAYNDAAGITAAFNRNLLQRANRELEGSFDVEAFDHHAFWNADASRIEMHLVSSTAQAASVAGHWFYFTAGESIHTENSYKYAPDEIHLVAKAAGFRPVCLWTDAQQLFGVSLLAVTG